MVITVRFQELWYVICRNQNKHNSTSCTYVVYFFTENLPVKSVDIHFKFNNDFSSVEDIPAFKRYSSVDKYL